MINSFAFSTQLLGECSRRRGLLTLEEAVQCITQTPARQFGLTGRGELKIGNHADLVVFDPETVACGPIEVRFDLPEDQPRLFADSEGISLVVVNGQTVVKDRTLTGALAGKVLHSGQDTHTIAF
jgi:N-acyl-D-aspartate/D-glutamate deacylase